MQLFFNNSLESIDPDQTAPEGAVLFGSALFACAILSATLMYKILGQVP